MCFRCACSTCFNAFDDCRIGNLAVRREHTTVSPRLHQAPLTLPSSDVLVQTGPWAPQPRLLIKSVVCEMGAGRGVACGEEEASRNDLQGTTRGPCDGKCGCSVQQITCMNFQKPSTTALAQSKAPHAFRTCMAIIFPMYL